MQTEPPKAEPPKRKRRAFQFSMRTLMIVTLICAIGAAWLGQKIERKRKEREAVEAITNSGGGAFYDYQRVKGKPGLWQRAEPYGPAWLQKFLGEHFFSEVDNIHASGGLDHLRDLPNLPSLWLMGGGVTDAGLVNLKGLTNLKDLGLIDTNITDAAVKDLQKAMPNCKVFVLHRGQPSPVAKNPTNREQPMPTDRAPDLW